MGPQEAVDRIDGWWPCSSVNPRHVRGHLSAQAVSAWASSHVKRVLDSGRRHSHLMLDTDYGHNDMASELNTVPARSLERHEANLDSPGNGS